MNVIMERYPYRYVECGTLENGKPDYRIQKQDEYTKWLDPEGVPWYVKGDNVNRR